jgi:hypothetical protein
MTDWKKLIKFALWLLAVLSLALVIFWIISAVVVGL